MFGRIWSAIVGAAFNATNNSAYSAFYALIDLLYRWGLLAAPAFYIDAISTSNIAGTYANGTAGVGATLTKASAGAFPTTDNVPATLNMYVLLTAQSTPQQNGLYLLTTIGSSTVAFVLTRFGGWDQSAEMIAGSLFYVNQAVTFKTGSTSNHAGQAWAYTAASSPTVGTTALTFAADSLLRAAVAATITAVQTFAAGTLKIFNAGGTFATLFATNATAARTVTFPDASITVATVGAQTGAPSATGAPTFTGTAPTSAINPAALVTGTGMTASGQTMTSTDTKTATLNQYAGCWLLTAAHGPYLIASNTAVSGAVLVLTIATTAPTTDAGVYGIYAGATPVGTISAVATPTHTHTQA